MDRASGSGVFARDPDALIDMLELEIPQKALDEDDEIDSSMTAWRIEGTLREFPSFKPKNVFYDWPIHRIDTEGTLNKAFPKGSKANNVVGKGKGSDVSDEERYEALCKAYEMAKDPQSGYAKKSDMAKAISVDPKTIKRYCEIFSNEFEYNEALKMYIRN